MTTFSSKGIVRSDETVDIQEFVLPVQAYPQPGDDENRRKECIRPEPPVETVIKKRSPVGVKEGTLNESDEILEGVKREVEQRIRESKKMAEDILDAVGRQAEHIMGTVVDDGHHSGYEEGFKVRVDRAAKEYGKAMAGQRETSKQNMKQTLASVEEAEGQCLRTYLEELKDCSVAVTEKAIYINLEPSGEIIKRMTISETERLKKTTWVKIYMGETKYEMMM